MEKDIENLARGEVQSGKWNFEVLEVDGSLEEKACTLVVGVCPRFHWGRGHPSISPSRKDNPLGTRHRGTLESRESLLEVWVLTGQS